MRSNLRNVLSCLACIWDMNIGTFHASYNCTHALSLCNLYHASQMKRNNKNSPKMLIYMLSEQKKTNLTKEESISQLHSVQIVSTP